MFVQSPTPILKHSPVPNPAIAPTNRLFDFGVDAKAGVGIPSDLIVPPFAVVASNKFDEV